MDVLCKKTCLLALVTSCPEAEHKEGLGLENCMHTHSDSTWSTESIMVAIAQWHGLENETKTIPLTHYHLPVLWMKEQRGRPDCTGGSGVYGCSDTHHGLQHVQRLKQTPPSHVTRRLMCSLWFIIWQEFKTGVYEKTVVLFSLVTRRIIVSVLFVMQSE